MYTFAAAATANICSKNKLTCTCSACLLKKKTFSFPRIEMTIELEIEHSFQHIELSEGDTRTYK